MDEAQPTAIEAWPRSIPATLFTGIIPFWHQWEESVYPSFQVKPLCLDSISKVPRPRVLKRMSYEIPHCVAPLVWFGAFSFVSGAIWTSFSANCLYPLPSPIFFSNWVVLFKKLICKQSLYIRDSSQFMSQWFALKILLSLFALWLGLWCLLLNKAFQFLQSPRFWSFSRDFWIPHLVFKGLLHPQILPIFS